MFCANPVTEKTNVLGLVAGSAGLIVKPAGDETTGAFGVSAFAIYAPASTSKGPEAAQPSVTVNVNVTFALQLGAP